MDSEKSPMVQQRLAADFWTTLLRPCLAEFVGTTLFVFAGILSADSANEDTAIVNVALGHGLALFVMVAATAAVR